MTEAWLMRPWLLLATLGIFTSCGHLSVNHPGSLPAPDRAPLPRAAAAWKALASKDTPEGEHPRLLREYHTAVSEIVKDVAGDLDENQSDSTIDLGGIPIRQASASSQAWSMDEINHLKIARPPHPWRTKGLVRDGIGVPVMAVRKPKKTDIRATAAFLPPKGQYLPATAVVEFSKKGEPILKLYDPREKQSLQIGDHTFNVAADYFTPMHHALERKGFLRNTVGGALWPDRVKFDWGLYMLEPYRADKIPVVFVHGLLSDPHVWEEMCAALMSDPVIGPRIQCWYFVYPTGIPIVQSSATLREALEEVKATFGTSPAARRMVFVGHSMGGLVSRLQVTESGDDFWKVTLAKPVDATKLDVKTRAFIAAHQFHPNPDIDRLVFIATPHQGSKMADSVVGLVGAKIVKLPADLLKISKLIVTLDLAYLRSPLDSFAKAISLPNSIQNLSPKHPLFAALKDRPIHARYHSVIADLFRRKESTRANDGVVPYASAHLEGAESEVIVPRWHGRAMAWEAIEEVRRILLKDLTGQ